MTRFVVLLVGLAWGCGRGVTADRDPSATVIFECEVEDAVIWVDERMIGEVMDFREGIRLGAGSHRVEVRHDNYFTRYLLLSVAPLEVRKVIVVLSEVLD